MPRLILVSNRLPVTVKADRGEVAVTVSPGGLAAGLRRPHEELGGPWIGYPGDVTKMTDDQRRELEEHLRKLGCVPVHLSAQQVSRYYDGFSNGVLWPLCHYLLDRIPPHSQQWEAYREVNEVFADAVARTWQPGDVVWVHDYQLALVPQMVRARVPSATIGFFLHIPFPASEVFRILPWRAEILQGILGADLIGFHTFTYLSHFASSALHILGVSATRDDCLYIDGRRVQLGVFPMGVDAQTFGGFAEDRAVLREAASIRAEARRERILLGVDRLDYTKGIPARLLAFERLLEREPQWRGKVRLVQVGVPSRDTVPSYRLYRRQINELVGRINGAFSTVDWVPIHYVRRAMSARHVAALYRAADVMLVTPLRDGMNLVAKEFVASRSDEDGVLVLSEFAGAAVEMGEALQVNPYDIDGMAQAYSNALTMPEEERRVRMRSLRHRVLPRDVHKWASNFLDSLRAVADEGTGSTETVSTSAELAALADRLRRAERLVLLLDYDGTLVPFAPVPDLATPDRTLKALLTSLAARPGVSVHVVSGRRKEVLERWLGDLPIGLHAEHGYWSRTAADQPWSAIENVSLAWKPDIRKTLDEMTAATPGALVEEKTASLAWHWRMAEPELGAARAESLWRRLDQELREGPAEALLGDKVIEVRPRGVSKARVVERLEAAAIVTPTTLVAAMGDDRTDEDTFVALPPEGIAIGVGYRCTIARYRVATPHGARAFLANIAA
jgi:trehalose 6-phosphate synthase/phosphatase